MFQRISDWWGSNYWLEDFIFDIVGPLIAIIAIGGVIAAFLIWAVNDAAKEDAKNGPYIEVTTERINKVCPQTGVAQVSKIADNRVAVTCKSGKTLVLDAGYRNAIKVYQSAEGCNPDPQPSLPGQ